MHPPLCPNPPPPCPMPINVGVLSTAAISKKVRKAIAGASNCTLTAVSSRDLGKAQAWAKDALSTGDCPPPITPMGSYEEMLADPSIHAVYIPLPCGLHLEWVTKAAKAGKGVLCEKPTAASVAELEVMIQACSAASVPFLDGTMFHFHKRMEEMKALWSQPTFGPIGRVNSSFSFRGDEAFFSGNIRTDPALEPFGCLGDLGQYSLRFGLEVFGWELPANVRCVAHQTNKAGVPMDISATFVYPTGGPDGGPRTILCDNSFTMAFHQTAEVIGTRSRIHVDDFVISASHASCEYTNYHLPNLDASHCSVIGFTQVYAVKGCNQEKDMWEAFGKAVGEKRFVPLWAERALKVQACLDAALLSSKRDGAPVEIKRPALLDNRKLFPDGCA